MLNDINKRRGGFTLVEIMIVVAIIALLATIAIPGFLRARKRSQASRVLNELRMNSPEKDFDEIRTQPLELRVPEPQSSPQIINLYRSDESQKEGDSYAVFHNVDTALTKSDKLFGRPKRSVLYERAEPNITSHYELPDVLAESTINEVELRAQKYFPTVQVEPAVEEIVSRVPHIKPEPDRSFAPGEEFDALVYVDTESSLKGEASEPIKIPIPKGDKSTIAVEVCLIGSQGLSLVDQPLRTLKIDPTKAQTESLKYRVRVGAAAASDKGMLTAYFAFKGRPNGKVQREIKIDSPSTQIDHETATFKAQSEAVTLTFQADVSDPDLTIEVLDPQKDNRHLQVIVRTPWLDKFRNGVREDWTLPQTTAQVVSQYMSGFIEANSADERMASLEGSGLQFYMVTPNIFQEAFWALIDGAKPFRTIYIVSEESYFPWELVKPQRPAGTDRHPALGSEFAVGRWITDKYFSPPQSIDLTTCSVVAPDYKGATSDQAPALKTSGDEATTICGLFKGKEVTPASWSGVSEMLRSTQPNLIHFACHGVSQPNTQKQILFLDDPDQLDSVQLSSFPPLSKPFVFINACQIGRQQPSLSGPGGFVTSFIRLGATGVIAPLWSVRDSVAHDVAIEFYNDLKKNSGDTFASIISSIRKHAYAGSTQGEDSYAAYCFYGDPLAKMKTGTPNLGGEPLRVSQP